MTFILRWPAILAPLALVLVSLGAAIASTIVLGQLPVDLTAVLAQEQIDRVSAVSWVEVGLWYGAGFFFLIWAFK